MTDRASLETELILSGRSIVIQPVPDDLAVEVLATVGAGASGPRRRWPGWWSWVRARRRRVLAAIVVAVLLVSALTPPVRAAVIDWLRIGGVMIRTGPTPELPPPGSPGAPAAEGRPVSLDQARAAVDFPIGVPSTLGPPERVTVTDDRRVVGMDWTVDGRPVHLDQLDGTISWAFLKRNWSIVTPTEVDGADAAWLADPHEIAYIDRNGVERRETARLSGPCLVWQPRVGDRRITARLEGIGELATARSAAESLR